MINKPEAAGSNEGFESSPNSSPSDGDTDPVSEVGDKDLGLDDEDPTGQQVEDEIIRDWETYSAAGLPSLRQRQTGYSLASAIKFGNLSSAESLLREGADPNFIFENKSLLHLAVESGTVDIIKCLCEHRADLEVLYKGRTPLLYAAQCKRPDVVRLLCHHGAKMDARCSQNRISLHCALSPSRKKRQGQACDVIRTLLEFEVDVNAKDCEGKTPLHYTVGPSDEDSARLLLHHRQGIILDAQDKQGRTPLHHALKLTQYNMAKLFLDSGATKPEPRPRRLSDNFVNLLKMYPG